MDEEVRKATERIVAASNRILLHDELATSGLPEVSQRHVEREMMRVFASNSISTEDIRKRIAEEKEFLTGFTGSPTGRVSVTDQGAGALAGCP